MRVPGGNLLKKAMRVIANQTVTHHAFSHRALNDVGQYVTYYKPARVIRGSFQPMARSLIQQNGLDLNASYITFYVSKDMMDVTRDVSGDQIVFSGKRYQCLSENDWFGVDGWTGVLCVLIAEEKVCA